MIQKQNVYNNKMKHIVNARAVETDRNPKGIQNPQKKNTVGEPPKRIFVI